MILNALQLTRTFLGQTSRLMNEQGFQLTRTKMHGFFCRLIRKFWRFRCEARNNNMDFDIFRCEKKRTTWSSQIKQLLRIGLHENSYAKKIRQNWAVGGDFDGWHARKAEIDQSLPRPPEKTAFHRDVGVSKKMCVDGRLGLFRKGRAIAMAQSLISMVPARAKSRLDCMYRYHCLLFRTVVWFVFLYHYQVRFRIRPGWPQSPVGLFLSAVIIISYCM